MTRQLATHYETLADAIEGMRTAAKDGSFFQYRDIGTRKHGAIDITSCGAAVAVWDALTPENRVKYVAKFGHHPGKFALFAWKFVK